MRDLPGIVDHPPSRRHDDGKNPMEAWIWPVGCTNTVLSNMFKIEGHAII
ncbi:hypothetical protein OH492_19360 [Vibrio chagasii]|nr:hypothetical protein [Vibrio chagasii]